jgi:hypothetical protein
MAALTAATTLQENVGSLNLYKYTFTTMATGDTFNTGLGGAIYAFWGQQGSITTQASTGISISNSAGTLTLKPGEDSNSWTIFVLAKA